MHANRANIIRVYFLTTPSTLAVSLNLIPETLLIIEEGEVSTADKNKTADIALKIKKLLKYFGFLFSF